MTQEISFISAGEDEKEAISFLLKFVEEKFLEPVSYTHLTLPTKA